MAGATLVAAGNGAPDLFMTALARDAGRLGLKDRNHQYLRINYQQLSATISNYQQLSATISSYQQQSAVAIDIHGTASISNI